MPPLKIRRGPKFHWLRTFRRRRGGSSTFVAPSNQGGLSSSLVASMVHMDMRLLVAGQYQASDQRTFFVTPVPFFGTTAVNLNTGVTATLTKAANGTAPDRWFTCPGDLSSGNCVLGTLCPMNVDLSEVVARDGGEKPQVDLGVLLKTVTLLHRKATGFDAVVSHFRTDLYPDATASWDPDLTAEMDRIYSRMRVRVGMVAEEVTVSIANDSWEPVRVVGYEADVEVLEGTR